MASFSRLSFEYKVRRLNIAWIQSYNTGKMFHLWVIVTFTSTKICYDNPGNVPNKGRNFNTQIFGKMYSFVICMISRHRFQTKMPNFGDFGAKMSFFHYIINQKRNNFIKHCSPLPPVYKEAADIRDVYLYKKFAVKVGSWYIGGNDVL